MPTYVVKPVPAEDFFVAWSTVTDSPVACGSREEIRSRYADRNALTRADQHGTSCPDTRIFGWKDELFLVGDPRVTDWQCGAYFVHRRDLRELCLRKTMHADITDLIAKFEACEEDHSSPPKRVRVRVKV